MALKRRAALTVVLVLTLVLAVLSGWAQTERGGFGSTSGGSGSASPGGSSGNVQTNDGAGGLGAYGGAACTNSYVRALDASGAVTCATPIPTPVVPTPVPTSAPASPGGLSGNVQTNNGIGGFAAYAGATCTGSYLRALDASGAATCATPLPTATPGPTPVPTSAAVSPGGSSGDIQTNSGSGGFNGSSSLSFSGSRLKVTASSSANDDTIHGLDFAATQPSSPTAPVNGFLFDITSAGSASQGNGAGKVRYNAGYTGSDFTHGLASSNSAAGTGANLRLSTTGATNIAQANMGSYSDAQAATTGIEIAAHGIASGSSTQAIGAYYRATGGSAGSHIGGLFNANGSTEATDLKDVGLYAVIGSTSLLSGVNGSFAALLDGGTLPDALSQALRSDATLPASPSGSAYGNYFNVTGAGSASQFHTAVTVALNAGYSGSTGSAALYANSNDAGTGTTLSLGSSFAAGIPVGSMGVSTAAGTGYRVGGEFEGQNSTGLNVGSMGKAATAVAGTNIGALGAASGSTESSGLKNVGMMATLGTTDPASSSYGNVSAAVLADGASADILRGYNAASLKMSIGPNGEIYIGNFTVSGLPSCGSTVKGMRATVTDANAACTFGGSLTGSGSTVCPAYCDGSAWKTG